MMKRVLLHLIVNPLLSTDRFVFKNFIFQFKSSECLFFRFNPFGPPLGMLFPSDD